jgi:hypothetical protein
VQLYRYFVSQSSEFCHRNLLCCYSTSVCFCCLFRYWVSPENFGYTFVVGTFDSKATYKSQINLDSFFDEVRSSRSHRKKITMMLVRGLILLFRLGILRRCGDSLFFEYLPWQAMHFLQRSTHFSKTCYRPFVACFKGIVEQAIFLPRSSLFMVGKAQKSHRGEIWTP